MAQESHDAQAPRESIFPKIEEEMTAYWRKHKVFERSLDERSPRKIFSFFDGPPFATGLPHYGHLLQSAVKDAVPRYWTMKGYHVPRRWGWDCHGLPIENMIEKELKLASRRDIEAYGIDRFNAACRASVMAYEKEWAKYVDRIGRWVDFEHSYKTMDNDYIESVWWGFSELHHRDLVYKGVRVSLYCPRCATPLSNFEIAMDNSYVEKEDPAIVLKFPVMGRNKTFFLAWTTTPWSVPGVTGLAIHPDLMYVTAKIVATGEMLVFAEARQAEVLKQFYPLNEVGEQSDFEIVAHQKGSELVGWRFEPPYRFMVPDGDAYRVIPGDHVSAETGTGIVTTAPAFGEEDLVAARANHLPLLETVDEEGKFISACVPFAGVSIKEADPMIMKDLDARGFLYRAETIKHSVPVCWRCHTLLFYKAQSAWFIQVTNMKSNMLKWAEKIGWHPETFKRGRFGKGLESAPDWNVSRTRYWGSPIPVWECGKCDERTIIGSVAELKKKAKPETWPETLDLHRPGIDAIIIPCACGGEQRRIPEVFDCWVESGSMPFASVHYPFEQKKRFEERFPADFVAEAQDQTRGWFYTMHVLAVGLFAKPAFRHAVVTGLLMAEDGKKMSKSLKNYPDPWDVLTRYGGDALRYYFFTSPVLEASSPNFTERDVQTVVRGVLNPLWNIKIFYETYAGTGVRREKPRSAHVLDRWLFSRLTELVRDVTHAMDGFDLGRGARPIRAFIEDLSTWWLRRSRDRLKSGNDFERQDALKTVREVLEELAKVMAPFMPFLAEKMYRDIGGQKTSVHLERWPKVERKLLDERLLGDMKWAREVVSKTHEARVAAKVAVRQVLATLTIRFHDVATMERRRQQDDLLDLIRDEVNVEQITLEGAEHQQDAWSIELDTMITPELQRKGWQREFLRHVMHLRKEAGLQPHERISLGVVIQEGDVRRTLEEAHQRLAAEIKATQIAFTDQKPNDVRASADVSVGGSKMMLWLG